MHVCMYVNDDIFEDVRINKQNPVDYYSLQELPYYAITLLRAIRARKPKIILESMKSGKRSVASYTVHAINISVICQLKKGQILG